ncbi:MAG: TIR domain-containing protein, partial [Pseudomonadota bacterium]
MPRKTTTKYDGFISYRHTSRQIDIAASFQRALHQFAKSPWYRLRAVRLYRDETDLGASPDAWLTIEEAMDASRFLILMASPEASASHWINGEIRYWLQKKGQDSLVIVLTDGKLSWDSDTGQFDPVRTNALPPAALQYIDREPIWVDLTDVSIDEMKIEKTTFLNAVASVSSTLRGIPKEQLLGEDRRIQRRRFRFFAITATVVIGLVIATAYSIIEQRDLALKTAAAETKALEEQTARLKAEADALEARALAAEAAA